MLRNTMRNVEEHDDYETEHRHQAVKPAQMRNQQTSFDTHAGLLLPCTTYACSTLITLYQPEPSILLEELSKQVTSYIPF